MQPNKILRVAAFLACSWVTAPVSAEIVNVEYSGTAYSVYDGAGLFGDSASSLDGSSYSAKYVFDTSRGSVATSSTYEQRYGGTLYGAQSPALGATVTVNGLAYSFVGDYTGVISAINTSGFGQTFHEATSKTPIGPSFITAILTTYIDGGDIHPPLSLDEPFSFSTAGKNLNNKFGYFTFYNEATGINTFVQANIETITITAAVPEPETYAILLAGLALLGIAARRRKQREAHAG